MNFNTTIGWYPYINHTFFYYWHSNHFTIWAIYAIVKAAKHLSVSSPISIFFGVRPIVLIKRFQFIECGRSASYDLYVSMYLCWVYCFFISLMLTSYCIRPMILQYTIKYFTTFLSICISYFVIVCHLYDNQMFVNALRSIFMQRLFT